MTLQSTTPEGAAESAKEPSKFSRGVKKAKSWVIRMIALLLVAVVVVLAAWTWIALSFTYSHGERAGYVQKLSKKGWIFKTWEGELAMANLPGAMPEVFSFSIREDAVAEKLQASLGRRVRIIYDEHVGVPLNWFGETPYFVVGMEIVDDAQPPK
jgi:hypothetical protein